MDITDANKIEYFKEIVKKYPVEDRYRNILTQIQDIVEAMDIMDKIQINEKLLGQAIIDYFEDIDRMKKYEGIKRVNVDKIYGYGTYWLLRRKPIQLVESNPDIKYLYINEKVFSIILLTKMLREAEISFSMENNKMWEFADLLFYNFKYRTYTKKTLEIMVSAFLTGCKFKNT